MCRQATHSTIQWCKLLWQPPEWIHRARNRCRCWSITTQSSWAMIRVQRAACNHRITWYGSQILALQRRYQLHMQELYSMQFVVGLFVNRRNTSYEKFYYFLSSTTSYKPRRRQRCCMMRLTSAHNASTLQVTAVPTISSFGSRTCPSLQLLKPLFTFFMLHLNVFQCAHKRNTYITEQILIVIGWKRNWKKKKIKKRNEKGNENSCKTCKN